MINYFNKNLRWLNSGLRKAPTGAFRNYLCTGLPDIKQRIDEAQFFVLDFETTGLDHKTDHIISAGYTEIRHGRVQLGKSKHHLVTTSQKLHSHNVNIHHLTDDILKTGLTIQQLLSTLLEKMAGKVMIAHHHQIEYHFLQKICISCYQLPLPIIMIDTLLLERKLRDKLNRPCHPQQLRLQNLRQSYQLPTYHAHHATEDAIATAELFIAQINQRQLNGRKLRIKDCMV